MSDKVWDDKFILIKSIFLKPLFGVQNYPIHVSFLASGISDRL